MYTGFAEGRRKRNKGKEIDVTNFVNLDAVMERNFHPYTHESLSELDKTTNVEVLLNVCFSIIQLHFQS